MQIKKSPRDAQFPGAPRYETSPYGAETREEREDAMSDTFSVRHARPGEAPSAGEGPETPHAQVRSESVIDRHSSFDGQFETEHDMRIEGTISGEVICRGLFTVDREATAKVRVTARDAHIHGRLEGDVVCSGKLQLASTAHVTGTLKAALLVVEEGATVSGNIDTTTGAGASRPATSSPSKNGDREPGTVKSARRDLPSFAIVTSDDRAAGDRN
jgi:cytoskeletal protein CcmA (bactofilin family)